MDDYSKKDFEDEWMPDKFECLEAQKQKIINDLKAKQIWGEITETKLVPQVDTDKAINHLEAIFKQSQQDDIAMALKSITISAGTPNPTDNPSTLLLKELFQQVISIVKSSGGTNTALGSKIVAFVCKNTDHTNIAIYQSDFNIPIAFKIHKYSCVIQSYAINSNAKINDPGFETPKNYAEQDLTSKLKAVEQALVKEQTEFQQFKIETNVKLKEAFELQSRIVEVRAYDGSLLGERVTDKSHKQLEEILQALTASNAMGFPEQLYIYGAPGAGKTHLAKQIAKALGVRCFAYPMGPTITEGKLLGFNNIATGTFIPGWLYEAYKNGGLVALDEADLADASVLGAANSIDNDCFIFGNGELVNRHKSFYLIAFANTIGTGSTKGFIRNTLDAATRDRFTIIKLEYDEILEQEIYGNKEWALYVQKCRDYVTKHCQASIYITPRATRKGAAYLAAGIPVEKVMEWCIFKGCSEDIKQTIRSNVGIFQQKEPLKDEYSNNINTIAAQGILQLDKKTPELG